jgi:NAD(P)-dependent dehydrogenase (short-subunit alcohol dehydrogenase family)
MHRLGLKVAIADKDAKSLDVLAAELGAAHGESNVLAVETDVSKLDEVVRLRDRVYDSWGEVGGRLHACVCASSFGAGRCVAQ